MSECEHKTGMTIYDRCDFSLWRCEWGCGEVMIDVPTGKQSNKAYVLKDLLAELDALRKENRELGTVETATFDMDSLLEMQAELAALRKVMEVAKRIMDATGYTLMAGFSLDIEMENELLTDLNTAVAQAESYINRLTQMAAEEAGL